MADLIIESNKISILFVIPSFGAGGAERQLSELLKHLDPHKFEIHVAVFYDRGYYDNGELWDEVENLNWIKLHSLHKRIGFLGYFSVMLKLENLIRYIRPKVIHGYLGANLPVLFLGLLNNIPVVWGIRRTSANLSMMDKVSKTLLGVTAFLSRFTSLLIFNSEAGCSNYTNKLGFKSKKIKVISNGIDLSKFFPDFASGSKMRSGWGVTPETNLIGIVGRLHPVKDHTTFLLTCSNLVRNSGIENLKFVIVGDGDANYVAFLKSLTNSLGLDSYVIWTGSRNDLLGVYNALDVLILTSVDEGFPNVIGEAMACAVPCVSTRVGDVERIIGHTGFVVDIKDNNGLETAVRKILNESYDQKLMRKMLSRSRIYSKYSTQILIQNTERVLLDIALKQS